MTRLILRAPWLGAVALVALVGLLGTPGGALVAGSAPTAVVSPNPAVQDAVAEVRGNGWRALSMVTAVLCGNEALDGSKDCDLEGGTITQVFEDGTFTLRLPVRLPPSPCPCLIRITDIDSTTTYDLPFRIANAPVATPTATSPVISGVPALTVLSARVEDETSLASWFGAPAPRKLVLQVRNDSSGVVTAPLVTAGWGEGAPSNTISSPIVEPIAAGEVREISVPFELSAFAFGEYDVDGAVAAYGLSSPFESTTVQWPWGLLVAAVVLVQLVVLWVVRRNRRLRLRREAELAEEESSSASAAPDGDVAPTSEEAVPPSAVADRAGPTRVTVAATAAPSGRSTPSPSARSVPRSDIELDGPVTAAPWH